ncbi:hypothetical protein IID27_02160 [Patescibacteria group bacterium]|nr:hypothetical protein [Patescibacteria group bacterium]
MTIAKKLVPLILLIVFPIAVYAAPATIKDLFLLIALLFNKAIPVLVAIALLVFFWGVSKLILYADNETKRQEGINTIIWGLVALFVIVSVWGLVFVFTQTFFGTSGVPGFDVLPR